MGVASGVGKAILFILGLVILLVGIGLTLSLLFAIIGIPIAILGLIMMGLALSGHARPEQQNIVVTQQVGAEKQSSSDVKNEEALRVLKIRYAKGKISKEEFEEMKKDLEG